MATFAQLKERCEELLNDPSMNLNIPSLLNQGLMEIAGGMVSSIVQATMPPLPELFTSEIVMTDPTQGMIDMPVDFQRSLRFVVDKNGNELDIEYSLYELMGVDPTLVDKGSVVSCMEYGRKLYYVNVPEQPEELLLRYYRKPVLMEEDTDTPDGLPEHVHYDLLVNYALWKAFEFIESGLEGDSPNTVKYQTFFVRALASFELYLPDDAREMHLR